MPDFDNQCVTASERMVLLMKKKVIAIVCVTVLLIAAVTVGIFAVKQKQQKKLLQAAVQQAWAESIPEEQPSFLTALDERTEFHCIKVQKTENDCYTATFEVTSPDIQADLNVYQENADSTDVTAENLNRQLSEIIQSAELKTSVQTVTAMLCSDGTYHIVFNDGFIDAMFGYAYIDAMHALMAEM